VPGLQRDLCNLAVDPDVNEENIFVIPDPGMHSWGKWEDPKLPKNPQQLQPWTSADLGSGNAFIALQSVDSAHKQGLRVTNDRYRLPVVHRWQYLLAHRPFAAPPQIDELLVKHAFARSDKLPTDKN